jgi:hypothetical protein
MSGNAPIIDAMTLRIGLGGYQPESVNGPSGGKALPGTVRKLIGSTSADQDDSLPCDIPSSSSFRRMRARMNFNAVPVDAAAIKTLRCRPPQIKVNRHFPHPMNYKPWARAFWQWLKRTSPQRLPNIDHDLQRPVEDWDLVRRFERELHRHGGWCIDSLFGPAFFEEEPVCQCVYMPFWCLDTGSDEVPLLEFIDQVVNRGLNGHTDDVAWFWPEQATVGGEFDAEQYALAMNGFRSILLGKKWRLLPAVWRKVCRFLSRWPGWDITFWDYEQVRVDFEDMPPERMQWMFDVLTEASRLHRVVSPLLDSYVVGEERFWASIIGHLLAVVQRRPELGKPEDEHEKK